MGLFDRILNPLNHGEDLKKVVSEYQSLFNEYIAIGRSTETEAERLFKSRKFSLELLQRLESALNDMANIPACLKKSMDRALASMAAINDAVRLVMEKEAEISFQKNTAGKILAGAGTAGAVAGAAGAPIAMAIATTFGTASTGAAISTLGGAAATNAALAWLGGGALAAGGGGVAAGTALLTWLGPIGWGLGIGAGGILVVKSLRDRAKNDEQIKKIKQDLPKIKASLSLLRKCRKAIWEIQSYTDGNNTKLSDKLAAIDSLSTRDFNDETFPRSNLFEAVSLAKFIGKLSNQYVNLSDNE